MGREVVDVRTISHVRRLMGYMARHGVGIMAAGKCLTQRRGLDDTLMGELLVRGRDNAQSGRSLVPSRHARRLGGELRYEILVLAIVRAFSLGGLLL